VEKISKSRRNGTDPDDILKAYGADAARWFILSDSPPERDVEWTESGIEGAARFLQRVWRLVNDAASLFETPISKPDSGPGHDGLLELRKVIHRAVARVGEDIENLRFNRAVAQIYELTNALAKWTSADTAGPGFGTPVHHAVMHEGVERLVQLVAPMMPHLAETCWEALGRAADGMVADAPWPEVDPALLVDSTIVVPVQVNGKRRGEIIVPKGADRELVEREVLSLEAVSHMLEGKPPKKLVIVPDRIVNVVV
jgi:leucyl-tRNA synthetase